MGTYTVNCDGTGVIRRTVTLATGVAFAYFAVTAGASGFLTLIGMGNYLYAAAQIGIIAAPITLLMIAGEFDLSVGSMVGAAEVAIAYGQLVDATPTEVFAQLVSSQLRRHIEPEEVARTISFLLSDDALIIRGQAVNADGGDTPY